MSMSIRRRVAPVLMACACLGACLPSGEAGAQQVVSMSVSIGGAGPDATGSMITKRFLDRAAKVSGMSAEQAEQAGVIHDGYASAYEARRKAHREALDEARRSSEDTGDFSAFMERLPGLEKSFRDDSVALETDFLKDVRSLLTPSQESAWPKVERMRRRDLGLPGGSISGESIDVIALVDELDLATTDRATLDPVLESYELELDRLMVARLDRRGDREGWTPGKPIDIQEMQASMAKAKEEGIKVRDLHRDAARKVEALLPEGLRATFLERVQSASFPRVYRKGRTLRELEAAAGMSDLDESQRSQVADLLASYQRDAAPLNAAWAKAIEASENDGQTGGAGGGVVLSFGNDPEELQQARKARRELDEQVSKRLRAMLSDGQRDRLPKAGQGGGEEGELEGNAVIIRRAE
ncbi:MAG: hypothetical protein RL689_1216 [Planctomycetota bacterium]|jgi:hypothetical protein